MMIIIVVDIRVFSFALFETIFLSFLDFIFPDIKIFPFLLSLRYLVVKYLHNNIAKNNAKTNK